MFAISHGIILFLGSYRKQMHMVPAQPWLLVPATRSQLDLKSSFSEPAALTNADTRHSREKLTEMVLIWSVC